MKTHSFMQNVRCTSLFKILSTKKPIFKKSENCDQEKENHFDCLTLCHSPLENLKQSIKEEKIYAIYYIECLN